MKICWDNLEGLRYIGDNKWRKKNHTYIYEESCKYCGKPFLRACTNVGLYCDIYCSSNDKKGVKRSPETIQKMKDAQALEKHSQWKGDYRINNIPTYDIYANQLEWCEKVRRNKKDINILEIRCTYCGKWYIPTLISVKQRRQALNNELRGEHRLYCSEGCKKACSIYGKSPEQLMREDAIRVGRLGWLELNREVQPELRKMVLERDGYQCVKCGSKGSLHCHHIYPVSIEFIESADMDNCMTLCVDCHKEAHKKDGCKLEQLRIEVC